MTIRKRIPDNEEEYDLMLETLDEKCPNYKAALDISDEKLSMLHGCAVAYHGWRVFKVQLHHTKTSITKLVKELFEGDPKDALPALPDLTLEAPPMPAKPGIETQIEKFIGDLERHDNFTDAIGLDLGFYVETSDAGDPEDRTGDFKTKDYADYETDVIFALKGADAVDLRWRVKGETAWNTVRATSSPYRLVIPADPNGAAITLEMQLIFVEDNKSVGNWSDLRVVVARA